jgi:hypothetical protein
MRIPDSDAGIGAEPGEKRQPARAFGRSTVSGLPDCHPTPSSSMEEGRDGGVPERWAKLSVGADLATAFISECTPPP